MLSSFVVLDLLEEIVDPSLLLVDGQLLAAGGSFDDEIEVEIDLLDLDKGEWFDSDIFLDVEF